LGLGFEALDCVKAALKSETGPRVALSEVTLKAPIQDCEKIICIGMNYVDHCTEQNIPVPDEPIIFNKFASTIANPGDDIIMVKDQTKELDFEVELAIVIGKEGKEIKQSEAMDYVFGYTVAHDVSARDWQLKRNGGQWLLGKTFDTYSPIGPAIVSTEEIGDPHKLGNLLFLPVFVVVVVVATVVVRGDGVRVNVYHITYLMISSNPLAVFEWD
jgi:2-keto-4-pentenoate hydratase/2-oxohepta-3-ene-1,7-dioic acid hydratase in catechol pathway